MATWQIFNSFKEAVCEGTHDLQANTLKIALTNTSPVLTNTVLTDISQISSAGGYAPATLSGVTSSQTGGTYTLAYGTDLTFTASGAAYQPFRYLVLYNDTAASDPLVGYLDYGISYTLPDTQSFVLTAGTVFTLA